MLAGIVHAQPVQVETRFERDVSRYRWLVDLDVRQTAGAWNYEVLNQFSSDAFLLSAGRMLFRDENQLAWQVGRPVRPGVLGRIWGRSSFFGQSQVYSQDIYAGLRYQPSPYFWIEPSFGAAWDRRPGVTDAEGVVPLRLDAGPAYGASLHYAPPALSGYSVRFDAGGLWQVITPRRGRSIDISGLAGRTFESTRIDAQLRYASFRRDAYQAVSFLNRDVPSNRQSETVEATTSDTLVATIQMDTPFYGGFHLTSRADLAVNNRFVRTHRAPPQTLFFDTDFGRRALDIEAAILYDTPRFMARLAVQRGAEVERRELTNREDLPPVQAAQRSGILEQADFDQGYLAMSGRMRASAGRFAVFTLDGSASILRHDTPESNLDDRDEAYHNAQAGLLLLLSRYLQVDVTVFGTYYHTVYLDATRSAENNTRRSLRLRPSLQWTPSEATRIRLGSELRATYTVDDFVLPGRRSNDQSARELRYDLDVEQDLIGDMRLMVDGSLSHLFLGRLLWNQFAEIPFDTLQTYSGWIRLQTGSRIKADIGVRFFIRSDFERATSVRYPLVDSEGMVVRDDEGNVRMGSIVRPGRVWIEQMGPTCSVFWPMNGNSAIRLDGWLNVQRIRKELYGNLPSNAEERIRDAARHFSRMIVPNVSLTVLWNL